MLLRLVVFVFIVTCTSAYRILLVSPMPGGSHAILAAGVIRHLTNAGHEIVHLSALPLAKSIPNVTIIDLGSANAWTADEEKIMDLELQMNNEIGVREILEMYYVMVNIAVKTVHNSKVQEFISDESQKFDLVIAEWLYSEIYTGFSAVFDCPIIWLSTLQPHWGIFNVIDECPNPSYIADILSSNIPPFSFLQRVEELLFQILGNALRHFYISGIDLDNYNSVFVPAITKRKKTAPSFEELKYNAALVLGNSHVSLGHPTRTPENYKHVGGYHIHETVKPLPEDLKKLIEGAKYGVIYFSMGSNLKSKSLPNKLKQNLLKMFSTLKQTVIWKFEEDFPNLPKNVHMLKWAPQQSILAHPNVILFITHGGQLSTTEAIHFGVPIIGIPVFVDQFANVNRSVKKGFGKKVDLSLSMADSLQKAINEMLNDPRYKMKVKELSAIYHDRPVSPGKELVHWVEHVIKTNGAPHMRSPALMVSWYQKCYMDLVLVIILVGYSIKSLLKWLIIFSCRKYKNTKQKLN